MKFNIDRIAFIGRSFNEYMKIFDLNENCLKNRRILDCPSGASSFTAIASRKGYDVTASDILYGIAPDKLEERCERDVQKIRQSLSGIEDMFVWEYFKNPDELLKHRIVTYKTFISDYRKKIKNRYIKAELPGLPFKDNEFSLVLSSHFLFLYDDRLDYECHINSINEMLRVAEEIRIFPLVGLNGKKSVFVDKITEDCQHIGVQSEITKVPYEFMCSGNEMMKII